MVHILKWEFRDVTHRIVVSQRCKSHTRWVLRFWLCRKSCGPQEHLRSMPPSRVFCSFLVKQETKFSCLVHRGSGIYCCGSYCTQILYLKQSLVDYNIKLGSVPLLCDNESVVKIAKNPVLHSWTKHIDIRHHFLREKEVNGDIALQNVRSEEQLADIFTKPLNERTFVRLRNELNVLHAAHVM
jgi:hypothetical protein